VLAIAAARAGAGRVGEAVPAPPMGWSPDGKIVAAPITREDGDGDGYRDEADGGWEKRDRAAARGFDGDEAHARCAGAAFIGGGAGCAR
jgi:hypothetical protein